jgi:hypothetical protein
LIMRSPGCVLRVFPEMIGVRVNDLSAEDFS